VQALIKGRCYSIREAPETPAHLKKIAEKGVHLAQHIILI